MSRLVNGFFILLKYFAVIIVICLFWEFCSSIICALRKREPYYRCGGVIKHLLLVISKIFSPDQMGFNVLMCVVLLFGALSLGLSLGETKNIQYRGIGSEYEDTDVTYRYEAMLYAHSYDLTEIESYLPCIATIYCTDRAEYILESLSLPYGKTFDLDEYIGEDFGRVDFGEHFEIDLQNYCVELVLIAPCTHASHEALRQSSPQYATFFASKKGDTIHFSDCAYLERIQRSNIIHFSNEVEAELYGYKICTKCYDKHLK